jgi:hypothetical protein
VIDEIKELMLESAETANEEKLRRKEATSTGAA